MPLWRTRQKQSTDLTDPPVPSCCAAHVALYHVLADPLHGWYVEQYHALQHGADLEQLERSGDRDMVQFADGSQWRYGVASNGDYGYTALCPTAVATAGTVPKKKKK